MAKSSIEVPELGTVFITKKRGQHMMRLRVDTKGQIQVSVPWLVPRPLITSFVTSKKDWIKEQQADYDFKPYNGMLFGKSLRLVIMQHAKSVRTKQIGNDLFIYFAGEFDPNDKEQIAKIHKAMMKSLRVEAERILLPRLRDFAELYDFTFASSSIKQVVGRWGSCDSTRHISLSLYLIQLPIELIDYVLIHELTHTIHMNHSPAFWSHVERFCPNYKQIRKQMKGMQPKIYDAKAFMA